MIRFVDIMGVYPFAYILAGVEASGMGNELTEIVEDI